MPLSFGSRILNLRPYRSSTNLLLRLVLASSSSSSAAASSVPELPGARGGGGFPATIREGRAEIFAEESNSVFYNKAQFPPLRMLSLFMAFCCVGLELCGLAALRHLTSAYLFELNAFGDCSCYVGKRARRIS